MYTCDLYRCTWLKQLPMVTWSIRSSIVHFPSAEIVICIALDLSEHAAVTRSLMEVVTNKPTLSHAFLPKEKCFSLEGKGRTTRKVSRNSAFLLLSLNYPIYFCIWPQSLSFFRASRLVGEWSELDFHIKRKPHSTPREITFERWWQMCSSNK